MNQTNEFDLQFFAEGGNADDGGEESTSDTAYPETQPKEAQAGDEEPDESASTPDDGGLMSERIKEKKAEETDEDLEKAENNVDTSQPEQLQGLPPHMYDSSGKIDVRELNKAFVGMVDPDELDDVPDYLDDDLKIDPLKLAEVYKNKRKELSRKTPDDKDKPEEGTPESPDEYQYEPGDDVPLAYDEDDPALAAFKNVAHEAGLTEEQFNGVINRFSELVVENGLAAPQQNIEEEFDKLGGKENAAEMIDETYHFFDNLKKKGVINDGLYDEAVYMAGTAEGVKVFKAIRDYYGEPTIPTNADVQDPGVTTKADVKEMMNDPRYWQQNPEYDPNYNKKVNQLMEQVS